ncbi:MAG TPA: hypothetical protein VMM14_09530 [Acidimicrobiia bacterium]|nr:hypothetical protein [Acidimicrobiia bacterium]
MDKAMRQVEQGDLDPESAWQWTNWPRIMCAILDMDEFAAGESR